jgi:hypothetical protein
MADEQPDITGRHVEMWKIHQLLDLLYKEGVRHFLTYYRDGKVSVAERKNGHIRILTAYPSTEWQAVLDNLSLLEFASVYTEMQQGKLVLYALPVRGLSLPVKILEAMKS